MHRAKASFDPQWFPINEYDKIVSAEKIGIITESEKQLNRYVLPCSFHIARYEENGCIDAIIYQYAQILNPRNVAFGFKLFNGLMVLESNGGISSLGEAKMMCNRRAAECLNLN